MEHFLINFLASFLGALTAQVLWSYVMRWLAIREMRKIQKLVAQQRAEALGLDK